jgi:hypothetical protein
LIRHARGSKRYSGPEGRFYHLDEVFDSLNVRFFGGCSAVPNSPGASTTPSALSAITMPPTTPSS